MAKRKLGRPRLPEGEQLVIRSIRLPAGLLAELEAYAKADERSVSKVISRLLEEAMAKRRPKLPLLKK